MWLYCEKCESKFEGNIEGENCVCCDSIMTIETEENE